MTEIEMDWSNLQLEMWGHANSDEPGKDLVCCAESMLSQALVKALEDMKAEGVLHDMIWRGSQRIGTLSLQAFPKDKERAEVRAVFRTAVTGFRMLANQYPQFIRLREEQ